MLLPRVDRHRVANAVGYNFMRNPLCEGYNCRRLLLVVVGNPPSYDHLLGELINYMQWCIFANAMNYSFIGGVGGCVGFIFIIVLALKVVARGSSCHPPSIINAKHKLGTCT